MYFNKSLLLLPYTHLSGSGMMGMEMGGGSGGRDGEGGHQADRQRGEGGDGETKRGAA